jgi:hypothetical protein
MSDSFTPPAASGGQNVLPADFSGVTQNDLAIISAKHVRKLFIAALDSGALSCLPGKTAWPTPSPPVTR